MLSNQRDKNEHLNSENAERHFRTEHLRKRLGTLAARGGLVTMSSQAVKFFTGVAATIVLARFLTPEDYGLIGMVAVVTGFVSMFKDMGLSVATIQRAEITSEQVSTLFWVNVALSTVVMLLTIALAPGVAWFYHESRLTPITIGYALGFLFAGLTVQHEALLRRQMQFTALAATEIASLTLGLVVAIVLALRGFGYWALVANQLVQSITYATSIWIVCRWRPGKPVRYSGVRAMLAFGGNLTGFNVINYFSRNLDNLLIGRFWGSWQLGLYAKAYQLLLLPIDQINAPIAAVAVPTLSRLNDRPDLYRQAYLRILEKIAILTMPGMAFMIACSDWIVRIVLGPQWSEASRIFALLGIVGLVQPLANTTGWLFITQGRTHHMLQWGLLASSIIITSICIGLPWGAIGVATSYSMVFVVIIMPLLFWFVGRHGPVRTSDLYRTVSPATCSALAVLGILLLIRNWTSYPRPLLGLIASLGITLAVTLIVLAILPKGRGALNDLKESFFLVVGKKSV